MTKSIQYDDLAGRLITIKRGHITRSYIPYGVGVRVVKSEVTDFNGLPLRVDAINLPYLACRMLGNDRPMILDTRKVEIIPVSAEYAASLTGYVLEDHDEPENDVPPQAPPAALAA